MNGNFSENEGGYDFVSDGMRRSEQVEDEQLAQSSVLDQDKEERHIRSQRINQLYSLI